MTSFWSLVIEPGKIYKRVVDSGIQVSRAALDTSAAKDAKDEGLCQVLLEYEGRQMTVANLSIKHACFQTQLELVFCPGEEICFSTSGVKLPVTLTGVAGMDLMDMDDSDLGMEDMADEEEVASSDEESEKTLNTMEKLNKYSKDNEESDDSDFGVDDSQLEDLDDTLDESTSHIDEDVIMKGKKRKMKTMEKSASKAQKTEGGKEIKTITDETLPDSDSEDTEYVIQSEGASDASEDDSDEYTDLDEEDDFEDEEMEDEEEDMMDSFIDDEAEEGEEDMEDEEMESDEDIDDLMPTPEPKKAVATPEPKEGEKKSKKKNKKNKKAEAAAKAAMGTPSNGTPAQSKVEKLKAQENKSNGTPKGKKDGKQQTSPVSKTPKGDKKNKSENKENSTPKPDKKKKDAKTPKSEKKSQKQLRQGGVVTEDIVIGKGQPAKANQMVSVYYEGRLKKGNKLFDKNMSGPPLKFKLGKGEVIKGWDVGLQGMQVGGKRVIHIPPSMGYGKHGAGNEIPPHSHLIFNVTLLGVK